MISLIEKEVVERRRWTDRKDFLDMLAVAQSLPGILAVNISVAVGDKLKGIKGSFFSALGTIILPFLIILTIAIFLTPETIKNNEVLSAVFKGIRPAVTALIIAPVFTTAKSAGINWKTVWIPIVTACVIWSRLPIVSNPIFFIMLGGLFGYLYYTRFAVKKAVKITDDLKKDDQRKIEDSLTGESEGEDANP